MGAEQQPQRPQEPTREELEAHEASERRPFGLGDPIRFAHEEGDWTKRFRPRN